MTGSVIPTERSEWRDPLLMHAMRVAGGGSLDFARDDTQGEAVRA
jgi:hypothetical protein